MILRLTRILRRFLLYTNLTKSLSMCEGSLQKDKEKTQIYGVMMMRCGIKEQKMEKMIEWKRKDKMKR